MKKTVRYHFKEIDSTNTWAKENAHRFETDTLTVISSEEQTNGRGRFDRRWHSLKGNLFATFSFFIDGNRQDHFHIPQLLALSTVSVLENYDLTPILKWPNDILVNSKKIAGILCETVAFEERLCVNTGIGLNVNLKEEEVPLLPYPITSIFIESGERTEVDEVLNSLQDTFMSHLQQFLEVGFAPFLSDFEQKIRKTNQKDR